MPYTLVNPYCTLAQLKECLKRGSSDTDNEDALNKSIYDASRWIDQYTGRDYFYHDHSSTGLTFDDTADVDGAKLYFPYSPVISITEVVVAGVTLVSGTDYRLIQPPNAVSYLRHLGTGWTLYQPDGLAVIKGTFGYFQASSSAVPTGIPGHISWATMEVAAAFSGQHRKEVAGLDGMKTSVLTNTIPKSVFDILGPRAAYSCMV